MDYDKLPFHWRVLGKYQRIWCRIGKHVPVYAKSSHGKKYDEYFCEQCGAILTRQDWLKFFKKAKSK